MRRKVSTRLLCFLLSGIMMVSSIQMPVYAAESESVSQEGDKSEITKEGIDSEGSEETSNPVGREGSEEISNPTDNDGSEETSNPADSEDSETSLESADTTDADKLPNSDETAGSMEASDSDEALTSMEPSNMEETEEFPEYSVFFVNPLYEDILDIDEEKAEIELIKKEAKESAAAVFSSRAATESFQNVQDAADYVCEQMVQRSNTIGFYVLTNPTLR